MPIGNVRNRIVTIGIVCLYWEAMVNEGETLDFTVDSILSES